MCMYLYVYICIHGCCPKFLVPEVAAFTKKYVHETFAEPSPCMFLITSSAIEKERERESETDSKSERSRNFREALSIHLGGPFI